MFYIYIYVSYVAAFLFRSIIKIINNSNLP